MAVMGKSNGSRTLVSLINFLHAFGHSAGRGRSADCRLRSRRHLRGRAQNLSFSCFRLRDAPGLSMVAPGARCRARPSHTRGGGLRLRPPPIGRYGGAIDPRLQRQVLVRRHQHIDWGIGAKPPRRGVCRGATGHHSTPAKPNRARWEQRHIFRRGRRAWPGRAEIPMVLQRTRDAREDPLHAGIERSYLPQSRNLSNAV